MEFCKFFAISTCDTHFKSELHRKWLEIDQHNLHIKFLALNADFSSPSRDPLGSRKPAQAGIKDGYPQKVVILSLLARVE